MSGGASHKFNAIRHDRETAEIGLSPETAEIVCNALTSDAPRLTMQLRGVHSNLGCRDTFFTVVSLLENHRSEWGKIIHFWKALFTGFSKIPKSLPWLLQVKSYSCLSQEFVATHVFLLETYLLPHLLK